MKVSFATSLDWELTFLKDHFSRFWGTKNGSFLTRLKEFTLRPRANPTFKTGINWLKNVLKNVLKRYWKISEKSPGKILKKLFKNNLKIFENESPYCKIKIW